LSGDIVMKRFALLTAVFCFAAMPAHAQQKPAVDPAKVDAAIAAGFATAPAEWRSRLDQDETMKQCSLHRNLPPKRVADEIQKRERAKIQYPADGKFLGDWSSGEKIIPPTANSSATGARARRSRSRAMGCASPTIRRDRRMAATVMRAIN
jgi:hypothetical protein